MSYIKINNDKLPKDDSLKKISSCCPFGSIQIEGSTLKIDPSCRLCRICIKNGPEGLFELIEETKETYISDISIYNGIAVFIEIEEHKIHPVSIELLGKGKELSVKSNQPLIAVAAGYKIDSAAEELKFYGVELLYIYDSVSLEDFRIAPFTAVLEDFIVESKPSVLLVGGTNIGRSLAPRTAARFKTGLTADCTVLDITKEGELIQIRPAFGGNIMAQIKTPKNRPQIATVRYKIFSFPERIENKNIQFIYRDIPIEKLKSSIQVLDVLMKEKVKHLEEADVILAAGRGIGKKENLLLIYKLAEIMGAEVAGTRPLIEEGWINPRRQIGLSGRTVRPKLIITCGISGSVQFSAGMKGSEKIISINIDPEAPIFKIAHVGLVGNVLEIIPKLIEKIEYSKNNIGAPLNVQ